MSIVEHNHAPNPKKIALKRQLHDAWALYLYIVSYIVINTLYLTNIDTSMLDFSGGIKEFFNEDLTAKYMMIILINFVFTVLFLTFCFITCYKFPGIMLYLSVALMAIFNFIAIFLVRNNLLMLILTIFDFIFIVKTLYHINKNLEYLKKMLEISARIMTNNISFIIVFAILSIFLTVIQFIPALLVDTNNEFFKYFRYVSILILLWTMYIITYFKKVFITSLVSTTIDNGRSPIFTSFYNSIMALGSISYASLILAFVETLRHAVSDMEERQRKENKLTSLALSLLLSTITFLLNILGDIITFVNAITFPYLSVHGTSYFHSAAQSFELLNRSQFKPLLGIWGVGGVANFLSIVYLFALLIVNYICYKNMEFNVDNAHLGFILVIIIFTFLFSSIIGLLDSISMAFIYKSIDFPEALIKYDPELFEILKNVSTDYSYTKNNNKGLF